MTKPGFFQEAILQIERLSLKARGLGHIHLPNQTEPAKIEVISGLPGDLLLVELGKRRKGSISAALKQVLSPAPERIAPRCRHVPLCGGCSLQQMDYAAQLAWKQEYIEKLFRPLFNLKTAVSGFKSQNDCLHPILPCDEPWMYRNKMEFSFSQNKSGIHFLGLVIAGSKGRVMDLEECHLVSPWFVKALQAVRKWWDGSGLGAYRLDNTGHLRTLTLREGQRTKDKMAILTVSGNPAFPLSQDDLDSFVQALKSTVPARQVERLGLFLRVQQASKGLPTQFYEMLLWGPDHILETLYIGEEKRALTFQISPAAFFQPNTRQAEKLFSSALQMIGSPKEEIFDLYAGTATLSMVFAPLAKKITAIELNPYACFDAESNKARNKIDNLVIHRGDVGETLARWQKDREPGSLELVLLDPPRTGLDNTALTQVLNLSAKEILYISCNPAVQAQNLAVLIASGYSLLQLQPVDQFPHTPHIETIAFLKKL